MPQHVHCSDQLFAAEAKTTKRSGYHHVDLQRDLLGLSFGSAAQVECSTDQVTSYEE